MWPLVIVDFEASCLGPHSYPIEAGIARWDGPSHPVLTWSSLILPQPRWIEHGDWTLEAQRIHGIAPADLEGAHTPHEVVTGLRTVGQGIERALCDGGDHDLRWLTRLTMASGWPYLPFGLSDFRTRTMDLDPDAFERTVRHLETTDVPHRAGPDAVRLLQACISGLTGTTAKVRILRDRDVLPDS
jgi:hypothetical protein